MDVQLFQHTGREPGGAEPGGPEPGRRGMIIEVEDILNPKLPWSSGLSPSPPRDARCAAMFGPARAGRTASGRSKVRK